MFACMNPATDVGKKELPDGLRNRFTEYFIDEPQNEQDLILIVQDYLKSLSPPLDLKVYKQVKEDSIE
jgi:midasin